MLELGITEIFKPFCASGQRQKFLLIYTFTDLHHRIRQNNDIYIYITSEMALVKARKESKLSTENRIVSGLGQIVHNFFIL